MIKENWIRGIGSVRCSGQIIVITLGMKITIPASTAALEKFVDDLANHVESDFVSIASQPERKGLSA